MPGVFYVKENQFVAPESLTCEDLEIFVSLLDENPWPHLHSITAEREDPPQRSIFIQPLP